MDAAEERNHLFQMVETWYTLPEQINHYVTQAPEGPLPAESTLLQKLQPSSTILDLGCGAGRIAVPLAQRGMRVVGVDVSTSLLHHARAYAQACSVAVEFLQVTGLALPFADEQFDAVLAFKVYCYIPQRAARMTYLHEIGRVLRPGGLLLMTQWVVPDDALEQIDDADSAKMASQFSSLEPGDIFPLGQLYVHWFTTTALQSELTSTHFVLEQYDAVELDQGRAILQVCTLRKPM